jgi:hypothetical protein
MADQTHEANSSGYGEQASALRDDLSPRRLNDRLEEVMDERPKTRYMLDFGIVGKALLAAVVVTVVLALIFSPRVAAFGLVIVFLGGWLIGAQVTYDRRRGTRDVREDDSGDEDEGEDEDSGREAEATGHSDSAEEQDAPPRQAEARAPQADSEGGEDSGYQGNRGEVEAEQEQDDEDSGSRDEARAARETANR